MNLKHAFLKLFLVLFLLTGITRAQILNGDFETTPSNNCTGAVSWVSSPNFVQLSNCCVGAAPPNWWIDLTWCLSGNGHYIEQTVPTVVGRTYILEWDLGCLFNFTAAGLDVHVNGALQGNFANPTPGNATFPMNWQHFRICFVANAASTTVRFTGNAPGNPGVIGLDNVVMTGIEDIFALQVSPGDACNVFCLNLAQILPYPGIVASNIEWYVNGVLESSGPSTYCRRFPKNVPTPVTVVFQESVCGSTHTLQTFVTAKEDCPCDLQRHTRLTATEISCNQYQFDVLADPGYTIMGTYWTVDGQPAGGPLQSILLTLSPGTHTVCANMIGGITGEGELCCARLCTVVTTKDMKETTCGVFVEMCWQLTDEGSQWYFTNLMRCDECRDIVLNATQVGPWITQAFIPSSMWGPIRIVTREYIDAVNCRKCTVTFTVANAASIIVNMNGAPCQPVPVPDCMRNQTVKIFVNGHPEGVSSVAVGASIVLCCANPYGIVDPTYVIYSETDPCCVLIVKLKGCQDTPPAARPGKTEASSGNDSVLKTVSSLQIIPNPTASVFRISSDKGLEKYSQVEIKDLNGRVLLTRSNIDSETEIDVSGFSKGTYIVNVDTDSGVVSLKLISVND
jgi:hypothetical protein